MCFDTSMGKYNIRERTWKIFTSGAPSYIHFGHCKNESDVYNYHSAQYDAMYFDELTHWTEFQYTYLLTRLRPNVVGAKPFVKASANPGGIGHAWVRRRWRLFDMAIQFMVYKPDQEPDQLVASPSRCFVPAFVTDNLWIVKNDPNYIERLKSSPFKRQLLDGDWSVFSGQAFPEIVGGLHFIHSFPIPKEWPRWISLDYGYSRPFSCHWHAQNPNTGRIYTYRELYGPGIKEVDQAKRVVGMSVAEGQPEKLQACIADPSVFSPRGGQSSISDIWQQNGLIVIKGNNDRKGGKARMHSYLSMGPDKKPWWQIFNDRCPNLARTLPELVLDEHDTEDVDSSQEDHAYDECRYFLMHIRAPKIQASGDDIGRPLDNASSSEWEWFKKNVLKVAQGNKAPGSGINEING